MLSKYDYHHIQLISLHNYNKIIINIGQMIKLSCSQNIIIFILQLIHHDTQNKININVGHMIKLQWLNKKLKGMRV
jgi:hypothetical protein